MLKRIKKFIDGSDEPDINLAEDIKKRNRNFVITFAVISFIIFNLIMYFLIKV